MEFIYGVSHFERSRGSFPALPLINMVTETGPTEERASLQSRPGLEEEGTNTGAEPVKAILTVDGVLDGSVFTVAGGKAYKSGVEVGDVGGTGPARITGYEGFVFFNSGTDINSYDGSTYTTYSLPGAEDCLSIDVGASRLLTVAEGSGTFYWSDLLDDNIDALSFATAENSPDHLLDLIYYGDTLVLFGSETVEFWTPSGDQDLPFQPIIGRVFQTGLKSTGAVTKFKDTFAWVTDSNQVCISSPEDVISPPGLNTKIENSSSTLLWGFVIDGVELLCVRTDTGSFVYNSTTGLWSEFASYGETNWVCACQSGNVFGSGIDGRLFNWSDDYSDFGIEVERLFRAWLPIDASTLQLYSAHLRFAPGQTRFPVGPLSDPVVSLRTSNDGGFNWSSWNDASMGEQGAYRKSVRWNGLGSFSYPGSLLEVRVTDPVSFRVSGLFANIEGGSV